MKKGLAPETWIFGSTQEQLVGLSGPVTQKKGGHV
jgi:hypothetical protein